MAEAIAHMLLILGNPFAYKIGRLIISILTLGKLSIEPLPKKYPTHFVQAFDDDKLVPNKDAASFSVSHEMALLIGYFVIVCVFGALLYHFRDVFVAAKMPE